MHYAHCSPTQRVLPLLEQIVAQCMHANQASGLGTPRAAAFKSHWHSGFPHIQKQRAACQPDDDASITQCTRLVSLSWVKVSMRGAITLNWGPGNGVGEHSREEGGKRDGYLPGIPLSSVAMQHRDITRHAARGCPNLNASQKKRCLRCIWPFQLASMAPSLLLSPASMTGRLLILQGKHKLPADTDLPTHDGE